MPKSNQFAQFAASNRSDSSAGWLTTKKRGRDDAQIEQDKKKAINEKKNRQSRGANKITARKNTSSGNRTSKSKASSRSKSKARPKTAKRNEDDYESDDSFLADDESVVEYVESDEEDDFVEESDDEEEDELEILMGDDDDDDDGESDKGYDSIEEVESSPEKKQRRGKPTLKMQRGQMKGMKKKQPVLTSRNIINLDSSDEEDDILKPIPNKSSKFLLTELDSSDEDAPPVKPKRKPKSVTPKSEQSTTSKFFRNNKEKESITSPTIHTKKRTKKQKSYFADSSDEETENTPLKFRTSKNSEKTSNGGTGLSDTDDEAMMEAIALSKAIEESKKEEDKRLKLLVKPESKVIYKDDPESEEEEEDDDIEEVDAYVDEKEVEASHVLAAANNLSARIVSSMMKWFARNNGNTDGNAVPEGMICDGAISISMLKTEIQSGTTISEEKKDDSNVADNWITSEEMQRVCPNMILKDYQLVGVNWLALLYSETFQLSGRDDGKKKKKGGNGRNVNGVLADEMGLGKTAQTIAFLAWLKYRNTNGPTKDGDEDENVDDDDCQPHIIIVPASVLENWQREFEKFCPTMNVIKYHGSMAERQEIKNELRQYLPKKKGPLKMSKFVKKLDVVLTTFSYFSSEKSDDRSFLRKFDWNYMVVDEAHCLKNPKGQRYKNMDAFSTDRRLLLTGTPIQNSPKELMSLLCFLMPLFSREASIFDEDDKNDGGARMLEYFVRLEATGESANSAVSKEDAYKKLKQLLAPFVLRRRKVEVLGQWLPQKRRQVEWVPFDESTRNCYDSILAKHLQSKKDSSKSSSTHVFTALRKAANHALLLRTRHTSPEAVEHLSHQLYASGYFGFHATCTQALVKKELENFSDYDVHCAAAALIDENPHRKGELQRYLLQEEDLYCSPKFVRLKTMLPKLIREGHRILIFSQWTRVLDLLGCLLDTMETQFLRLDGQTTISERQTLIDQYTNDENIPVFLLSTRAGGMGINLTAADTCILHDLDFNPFNDIQAEDRVHRIGQKKPVTVIKMVTEKTVDSDIYKMQERKAEMNAAILERKEATSETKGREKKEMNMIFEMAVNRYNSTST